MYAWIIDSLSAHGTVIAHDRPGLGRSAAVDARPDGEARARQLNEVIEALKIEGPFVLIGHSIAALYLRIYFQRNPRNVLGLVFLDATHSLVWRLIQGRTPITERGRRFIARGAQWVGIKRLPFSMRRANAAPWSTLPVESRREVERLAGETIPAITESDEHAMLALASKQADACGDLGDTPLLVITGGMRTAEELRYATDPDAFMETWMLLQRDLVSLSSRGIHRVIADAGHCNLVTDKQYADQVCAEIVAFTSFIGLENLRT